MSIHELPLNVKTQIFSYLTKNELAKASRVCTDWKGLTNKDVLWSAIAEEILQNNAPIPKKNIKDFLRLHVAISNDEIIQKLQFFVNQINPGKNGLFRCFIKGCQEELCPIIFSIMDNKDRISIDETKDFIETIVAINGIGDGSLNDIQDVDYLLKTNLASCRKHFVDKIIYHKSVVRNGMTKVYIEFPKLPNKPSLLPLNRKIEQIALMKIDELNHPRYFKFTQFVHSLQSVISEIFDNRITSQVSSSAPIKRAREEKRSEK